MHEPADHDLLRQFAEQHSETAFAALVARHVDKVYATALRHTRNVHAAEEITQAVFVILAKQSGRLGAKVILAGWLYETARLTAVTYLRSEIRRTRREQEAHMQSALNEPADDAWPHLAPLLDDAMSKLSAAERHAVVLRYFDGKSLGEVGAALGASEDAAKKRVSRAVEKLRGWFTKRGVTLSATVLTATIAANSVQAAPAGLAATVTAAAVKGAAVSGSTLTLIKGALKVMTWTKAKMVIAVTAGLVLAAGTAVVVVHGAATPKIYETEMVESYQDFPLIWSKDRTLVSGPFLHQSRPAAQDENSDDGLQIGPAFLDWSAGDFINMVSKTRPGEPLWEFALSPKKRLADVTREDLRCEYYGLNDPRGSEIFGDKWNGAAINVAVGQIFFARLKNDHSIVYVIQLTKRELRNGKGAVMARYFSEVLGNSSVDFEAVTDPVWNDDVTALEAAPPMVILRETKFPTNRAGGIFINGKLAIRRQTADTLIVHAFNWGPVRTVYTTKLPDGFFDYLVTLPEKQEEALQKKIREQLGLVARRETKKVDTISIRLLGPPGPSLKVANAYQHMDLDRTNGVLSGKLLDIRYSLECYLQAPVEIEVPSAEKYLAELKSDLFRYDPVSISQAQVAELSQAIKVQLGLEVVPTNMPMEMLVVEKVK